MSNVLLTANKGSFVEVLQEEATLIEQLPTLPAGATILVAGTPTTVAQAVAQLSAHTATIKELTAARVQIDALVTQQKAQRAGVHLLVQAIKAYVVATLGVQSSLYGLCGFKSAKPGEPSAATKATAALKAAATKLKRHVMGKNQRAAIPPATEPEPAPAPAPTAPAPTVATPTVTR